MAPTPVVSGALWSSQYGCPLSRHDLEPDLVPLPPLLLWEPVADNGPAGAMEVPGIVQVGGVRLHHIEVGHQLLEAPLVVSPLRPTVVVLGNAADKGLPVDGAGPAGHLAPGNLDLGLIGAPGRVLPVVVAVPDTLGRLCSRT